MQQTMKSFLSSLSQRIGVAQDKLTVRVFDNTSMVQFTIEEFINQYNPEDIQKGHAHFVFAVSVGDKTIARFQLQDMLNCSGIIIFSDAYVSKQFQNRGIGTVMNQFCTDFSRYYGYGVIQATDKDSSEVQKKIFDKIGWKHISKFNNPKTKNDINIWMYFLND